jgi:Transposase IS116/IS110/IS902 family
MNEFEHMRARVKRLEEAILEIVTQAPQSMQDLIRGLQAIRGIAHISAVTIAAELGVISSRFESARKLMGYSGVFPGYRPAQCTCGPALLSFSQQCCSTDRMSLAVFGRCGATIVFLLAAVSFSFQLLYLFATMIES